MKTDELLMQLSNIDALSGHEAYLREYIQNKLEVEAITDSFGNLYAGNLATKKKKVALWAHMDEVGFFVKYIDKRGFVYFEPVGGWWGHVILGQKVRITCRKNDSVLEGIVGTIPKNSKMSDKIVPISEMYIDLGVSTKKEVEDAGVQLGDMILPASTASKNFSGKYITGKALDNRVACSIIIQVLNQFSGTNIELIGVATVQEESGTRGSKVAAPKVDADINIIIDVANGKDTPHAADPATRILGNGPGLVLADKTALANIQLVDFIKDIAEDKKIPYQYDLFGGGGTDAGSVQLFNGKPTIVLSVPVRYCHSWNSLVAISDVQNTINLLNEVVINIDGGE